MARRTSIPPIRPGVHIKGNRELRPAVAWPTIALTMAGLAAWAAAAWAGTTGLLSRPLASLLCAAAIFLLFTPMHDACHNAVVPKSRGANDAIGLLASLPFQLQYRTFRLLHLSHHAHLNDPLRDPDHWAGEGRQLLLPLRWATVFLHYFAHAIERAHDPAEPAYERERWRRVVEVEIGLGFPATTMTMWWAFEEAAVWYWLVPFAASTCWLMVSEAPSTCAPSHAAIADACLAVRQYVFDYLPHRPHLERRDAFRATATTTGAPSWLLTVLLLSQNMHNVHHLTPSVPFYKYGRVWAACREELLRRGTRQLPVLWPSREAHLPS